MSPWIVVPWALIAGFETATRVKVGGLKKFIVSALKGAQRFFFGAAGSIGLIVCGRWAASRSELPLSELMPWWTLPVGIMLHFLPKLIDMYYFARWLNTDEGRECSTR